MTNLKLRLLLIFTVIPLVFAIIFLLPFLNYLATHVLAALLMITGSYEVWKLFFNSSSKKELVPALLIPAAISAITYMEDAKIIAEGTILYAVGMILFMIFASQIFVKDEKEFKNINKRISTLTVIVIYPGLFFSFAPRLTALPYPSLTLIGFLVIVFMNDIFAYVFGMLFGRSNRNIFPISPKKSLAGFIGGFLFSIAGALIMYFMGTPIFGGKIIYPLATGAIIGIMAPVADLCESAIKRSANTKDSGNYIPGRGGVLDNIDSLIFSAPVYYYIIKYISYITG